MKQLILKYLLLSSCLMLMLFSGATAAPVALAQDVIVDNPVLEASCGLDIMLVIDGSGSIDANEYSQVQNAFIAFVDTFLPETPTEFALVEFASLAVVRQGFTNDKTILIDEINEAREQPGGIFTNWDDGLHKARSLFPNRVDKPDLIIFSSDGNPNRSGGHEDHIPPLVFALAEAIEEANTAKSSGVRIITVGIGSSLNTGSLAYISSPDAVITSDFDELLTDLAELSAELCGGTVTAHKIIDQDGNPATTDDQSDGAGWSFAAHVASPGTSIPLSGLTDEDGLINFDIDFGGSQTSTLDIAESVDPGFALIEANCSGASGSNGAFNGTDRVEGVAVNRLDIVSCEFYNAPLPVVTACKTDTLGAPVAGWQISAGGQTKSTGANGCVDFALPAPGNYTITEESRAGWTPVGPTQFDVTADYGGSYGPFTFVNARFGSITVIKNAPGINTPAFDFTFNNEPFELIGGQSLVVNSLSPGDYDIIETQAPNGWVLLGVACPNADFTGITDENGRQIGVKVHLEYDQNITCTFTNNQPNLAEFDSIEAVAGPNHIEIRWTTLTESNTVGFTVLRSTSPAGPFEPVNDRLILAEGNSFEGADYSVIDNQATPGVTYYYYIQELETDGIIDHNDEPWKIVSASIGGPSVDAGTNSIIYLPVILK